MKCPNCTASSTESALFCRACGSSLRIQEMVECENHPGTPAKAVCTVCGRPVCDDCSLSREGKAYCDDVQHSRLTETFTRLALAATEFEGDLIAKNLEPNGIRVLLFSAKPYSQFCRLTDEERISIYVAAGQAAEARRLLDESELTEFLSIDATSP